MRVVFQPRPLAVKGELRELVESHEVAEILAGPFQGRGLAAGEVLGQLFQVLPG